VPPATFAILEKKGERLECWWKIPYNKNRRCVPGRSLAVRSYGGTLWTPPSSSSEQVAEADRLFHVLRPAVEDALRRLTRLLASKPDDKLLGKTEFEVRDRVHAIGARAIETALNERNTGGTKGPA